MNNSKIITQILQTLGREHRTIISFWRVFIICRNILGIFNDCDLIKKKTQNIIKTMERRKELISIEGINSIYRVNIPFADSIPISTEHIIQEIDPFAVFSYLTAMSYYGMTNIIPSKIYVTHYLNSTTNRFPFGIRIEDFDDIPPISAKFPRVIENCEIIWTRSKSKYDFGHTRGLLGGQYVYITDKERTLLDCLESPQKAGGIETVLKAWDDFKEQIDIEKLIKYTEWLENLILRQRVGYILEKAGIYHPKLEEWRKNLQRGSSVKLLAEAPYSNKYSPRWNLSLNVPENILDIIGGE